MRGGNGAWGRCGAWEADIGGMGFAPPGFKTVLTGLGASTDAAAAAQEAMEGLLNKATRELWALRNKEQLLEEAHRGITAASKRDREAARVYRQDHPPNPAALGEFEEAEPGRVLRDDVGVVVKKACGGCGADHTGGKRKCLRCGLKLPSGARQKQYPYRRENVEREEDEFWLAVAGRGEQWATSRGGAREEWARALKLWEKRVESRGRGREADNLAGGPRGPDSDGGTEDDASDVSDEGDGDWRGERRQREGDNGDEGGHAVRRRHVMYDTEDED